MKDSQRNKIIKIGAQTKFFSIIQRINSIEEENIYIIIDDNSLVLLEYPVSRIRIIKENTDKINKNLIIITDIDKVALSAQYLSLKVLPSSALNDLSSKSENVNFVKNYEKVKLIKPVSDIVVQTKEEAREQNKLRKTIEKQNTSILKLKNKANINKGINLKGFSFSNISNIKKIYNLNINSKSKFRKIDLDEIINEYEKKFGSARQVRLKDISRYPGLFKEYIASFDKSSFYDIFDKLPIAFFIEKFPLFWLLRKMGIGRPSFPVLFLSFVFVFMGIFFFVQMQLPSTVITVTPKTIEEVVPYDFVASTSVSTPNFEKNIIPSQVLEETYEQEFTIATTGKEEAKTHAEGFIDIINKHSSQPQVFVQNTRFINEDGILFRLIDKVVVPGAKIEGSRVVEPGRITAEVRADDVGEIFNIKSSDFAIPGLRGSDRYGNFEAKSTSDMTGGFDGARSVVMQEDFDKLKSKASEEMYSVVEEQLYKGIPSQFYVIPETLKTDWADVELSAEVGEPADQLKVKFIARSRVFLIKEEHANQAFEMYIANKETKSLDGFEPGTRREIDYTLRNRNFGTGVAELTMEGVQSFRKIVDIDAFTEKILGKKDTDLHNILKNSSDFQRSSFSFWPFWNNRVSSNREDVEIRIEYVDDQEEKQKEKKEQENQE